MECILNRKEEGAASIGIVFIGLLMLIIVLCSFMLERYLLSVKANMARDDIVLSNLAAYREIDIKALGDDPPVFKVSNPDAALSMFKEYLKKNMGLDETMVGGTHSVAAGEVVIKKYIIYNISGNSAQIYTYDYTSNSFSTAYVADIRINPVISPCGNVIKKTSIHTTLEFPVDMLLKGILGNTRTVDVCADTDITY